uniref:Uncharacterized protein n=1 Tax=Knipowitschia caucasica TaxID=637954 RepID=A0AAV2J072_KNICA
MTLTKQVALAIRDSVELTRAKNTALENSSAVKKKLRWFDEVHVNCEDKGQITIKQIRSKSSSQLHSKSHSEDHQLSIGSVAGAIKAGPGVTRTVPNGYHFTRNAWADVGVQVSLPQQHGDEVKVQHRNNKSGGLKATTKERVEAAPVSSRTRKGTYIRPQSATEVSQIARAHGRLVMPRPPPPRAQGREEQKGFLITAAPYGTDHAKINCRPAEEFVLQRDEVNTCYPVYTNNEERADNGLMFTPHPPSYTCTNTDGNTSSKPRLSHHGQKAGMGHDDKSSSLKCTPTEEEISQLWFGVRTALATKDGETGVSGGNLPHVALRHRVVESTHNERRKSAPLAVRKLPHSAQPTKRTLDPDSFRFGRMNKDETQNEDQRHETFHQQHQPGFATISMEEDRILQSLDRLNHRLYYVQEQHPGEDRAMGFLNQYTTDLNATSPQKLHTGSYQSQTQKRL